jgi:hypothetical protein
VRTNRILDLLRSADWIEAPCRKTAKQRHDIGLTMTTSLFQNTAHLAANGAFGCPEPRSDVRNRFSCGKALSNPGLGRSEVKQRLHNRNCGGVRLSRCA